jgi:archaellum component FlaD/FlaE
VPGDRAISSADGKPYLTSIPDGFAAEVITVEWLEYLVEELGVAGTVRALQYYEKIDWLTEDAAEELGAYLDGFDVAQKGTLSVEHNRQTLEYVEELTVTGAVPDDIAESD